MKNYEEKINDKIEQKNNKLEKIRKINKMKSIFKTVFIFLLLIISIISIVKIKIKSITTSAEIVNKTGENELKGNSISNEKANMDEINTETTNTNELNKSSTNDWNLILVNKDNPIPENYSVNTVKIEDNFEVDEKIKESTEKMLADARANGIYPEICSAYRSTKYQTTLYNNKINEYLRKGFNREQATEQASKWVTTPGTSEHEIGLSLDIIDNNYQILDENQENTPVQKWLMEHCYEYGFILRYPTEKRDITKINYEPWHYRYVGVKNAMIIKEKGYCLEEYIEYIMK